MFYLTSVNSNVLVLVNLLVTFKKYSLFMKWNTKLLKQKVWLVFSTLN